MLRETLSGPALFFMKIAIQAGAAVQPVSSREHRPTLLSVRPQQCSGPVSQSVSDHCRHFAAGVHARCDRCVPACGEVGLGQDGHIDGSTCV